MHEPIDGNYALRSSLGGLKREPLPTMYDLPSEDPEEPGLPDEFHEYQPKLLRETYQPPKSAEVEPFFIGIDLNLYYDFRHTRWHKRPDWFLVLGVGTAEQQSELRLSYVTWEEGVNPFLVVELLSDSTEAEDLGQTLREANKPPTKWQVYEQILRIPYYAVYDRKTLNFRVFRLVGTRYEELVLEDQRYWFEDLKLGLGVWSGRQSGIIGQWLRWYDASGAWLKTGVERADQAEERVERLTAQLRSLGIDPND